MIEDEELPLADEFRDDWAWIDGQPACNLAAVLSAWDTLNTKGFHFFQRTTVEDGSVTVLFVEGATGKETRVVLPVKVGG